jgi:hypothetical protein
MAMAEQESIHPFPDALVCTYLRREGVLCFTRLMRRERGCIEAEDLGKEGLFRVK